MYTYIYYLNVNVEDCTGMYPLAAPRASNVGKVISVSLGTTMYGLSVTSGK